MFFISFQTWLFLAIGFCQFWLLFANLFVKFGYKAFRNLTTLSEPAIRLDCQILTEIAPPP